MGNAAPVPGEGSGVPEALPSDTPVLPTQAVPVELPATGRGPEDRPDDGGVRAALLPVQPRRVPVHR